MQIEPTVNKSYKIASVEKAEVLAEVQGINITAHKQPSQNQSWLEKVSHANNNIANIRQK